MTLPRIYTKATNVELTNEHEQLIMQRLAPLARLLIGEDEVRIDVNVRLVRSRFTGDTYLVMVKLTTPENKYLAAASKHNLGRAVSSAREVLRRSISRGASVADYSIRRARQSGLEFDPHLLTR